MPPTATAAAETKSAETGATAETSATVETAATVDATHPTPLGPMISVWTDAGLYSLTWGNPVDQKGSGNESLDERVAELGDCLDEYFSTGQSDFASIQLDPSGWTPFMLEVYRCCRQIGPGKTTTYKELAKQAGSVGASRAVGAAMARNRVLLVIPCHRVVSAGGGLRGFSAPGGLQTKQFLLDLEAE